MAGGASITARLQYLSAPESGGRQPRIRHDVNDPLLLAPPETADQQPPLWVLAFLLVPQQSAQWTPQRQRMGRCRQMASRKTVATGKVCETFQESPPCAEP